MGIRTTQSSNANLGFGKKSEVTPVGLFGTLYPLFKEELGPFGVSPASTERSGLVGNKKAGKVNRRGRRCQTARSALVLVHSDVFAFSAILLVHLIQYSKSRQ